MWSNKIKSCQRGFTLAELLSVIVILALVLSFVTLIIGPLLRSQSQAQAKTDTVQTVASALYHLERDLRNTDQTNVWTCSTSGPTCTIAPTSLTSGTNAVVFPTAYANGTGQFQVSSSTAKPQWQGVVVYWVDSRNDLNFAFDNPAGFSQGSSSITSAVAKTAVSDVLAAGGEEIGLNVQTLLVAVPVVGHRISLQLQAQSTINGSLNETTYTTDLMARN